MSDTHTIRKIYDIASAFITDRSALIQSHGTPDGVIYTFTKNDLTELSYRLEISVEYGTQNQSSHKNGQIRILRSQSKSDWTHPDIIMSAHPQINTGRAFDPTQPQIIRFGTRILSPLFFKLLNMAQLRTANKIPTSNNSIKIFTLLYGKLR